MSKLIAGKEDTVAEQIVVNIVRPEIGIEYRPESPEAQAEDQLAACELALHALARRMESLYAVLDRPCPAAVTQVIRSEIWRGAL